MTRAFVAAAVPHDVLNALQVLTDGLDIRGGRKTKVFQWHLTLQFLGDEADLSAVIAALEAFDVPGGVVQLGGAGAFPDARRGRVLWIGVQQGSDVLARLASGIARRLAPLGFEPDARPFRPHLTLVRWARPTDLRAPIAALGEEPVGDAWQVEHLTVYESQLRDEGARYVERASIPLPR